MESGIRDRQIQDLRRKFDIVALPLVTLPARGLTPLEHVRLTSLTHGLRASRLVGNVYFTRKFVLEGIGKKNMSCFMETLEIRRYFEVRVCLTIMGDS